MCAKFGGFPQDQQGGYGEGGKSDRRAKCEDNLVNAPKGRYDAKSEIRLPWILESDACGSGAPPPVRTVRARNANYVRPTMHGTETARRKINLARARKCLEWNGMLTVSERQFM